MTATYSINEHTGRRVTCKNCQLAPPFDGFDECLPCAVAITMDEQPDYLEFARAAFAHKPAWLAELEAEWKRQASASTC